MDSASRLSDLLIQAPLALRAMLRLGSILSLGADFAGPILLRADPLHAKVRASVLSALLSSSPRYRVSNNT